jgi:hypothetical protein
LRAPPADEATGEGKEGFVDVGAPVGTDEQAAVVVEPGEGALNNPAVATQPGAVLDLTPGDEPLDAALPEETAVLVVVVRRLRTRLIARTLHFDPWHARICASSDLPRLDQVAVTRNGQARSPPPRRLSRPRRKDEVGRLRRRAVERGNVREAEMGRQ